MKREEKNIQSNNKIMEFALAEFAEKGYGLSSINTICSKGNISKGIMYHYFSDKDTLYLECVKKCFEKLVEAIKQDFVLSGSDVDKQLEAYFKTRLSFFQKHPLYQRIFCDAISNPPMQCRESISQIKAEFDHLSFDIMKKILKFTTLEEGISENEFIEIIRTYQDFINASYQKVDLNDFDLIEHDKKCMRALKILLYGVVIRKKD